MQQAQMPADKKVFIDESKFQWNGHVWNPTSPIALGTVPNTKENIIVSVLDVVQFINKRLSEGTRVLYLKGVVASGKTTTLKVIEALSDNCLFVDCSSPMAKSNEFDKQLLRDILRKWSLPVIDSASNPNSLKTVLMTLIPENALLFIDEAHIAFQIGTGLLSLIKNGFVRCRVIFTSTTNPGIPKAILTPTPPDLIRDTFIPKWTMTDACLCAFVEAVWGKHRTDAKLKWDASLLAKFLMAVTGGHRGFCAELLSTLSSATNDINSAIGSINALFCRSGLTCRFVRPNGYFERATSNSQSYPVMQELMQHGYAKYDCKTWILRHFITIGTLASTTEHLTNGGDLRIPNPFYARDVGRFFKRNIEVEKPKNICDYLVYGIAYFGLECLFNTAEGTTAWYTRGVDPSPFELQIDQGIAAGILDATGITVTTGFSSAKGTREGKPDVIIPGTGEVIEYVLAGNDVQGHFDRFDAYGAYHQNRGDQLLVIFAHRDPMLPTVRARNTSRPPAKIAVVKFELETFWVMRVEFYVATEKMLAVSEARRSKFGQDYTHALTWGKYTGPPIYVDFVARHVFFDDATSTFELRPAQKLTRPEKRPREEAERVMAPIWVQQLDLAGKPVGQAFKVSPTSSDVDGLKKAILPNATPLEQARVTIFAPGTTAPAKPSSALCETTDDAPFLFQLP